MPATKRANATTEVATQSVPSKRKARPKPDGSRSPRSPRLHNCTVVIDTREQLPYDFGDGIKATVATLATGDYSVAGWTPFISVERKSWPDFYGCLTGSNRERFERELARLSDVSYPAIVVEASHGDLWKPFIYPAGRGRYRKSQVPPLVAQKSVISWSWRYKIPLYFCESRASPMKWTLLLLDDAVRQLLREQKQKDGASE